MKKLLLADDDRGLESLVRVMLKGRGFEVETAYDGAGALSMIENGQYSVVLLDVMMPKLNGMEVVQRLAASSPQTARRVIILTAADPRMLKTLDESTVGGIVLKPFDVEAMTALVEKVADSD